MASLVRISVLSLTCFSVLFGGTVSAHENRPSCLSAIAVLESAVASAQDGSLVSQIFEENSSGYSGEQLLRCGIEHRAFTNQQIFLSARALDRAERIGAVGLSLNVADVRGLAVGPQTAVIFIPGVVAGVIGGGALLIILKAAVQGASSSNSSWTAESERWAYERRARANYNPCWTRGPYTSTTCWVEYSLGFRR